jgi:hypothetical protein
MITVKNYEDALDVFETFGVREVTTKRQRNNGTRVFELPMRRTWGYKTYAIRFASYETGYVRNVSEHLFTTYQMNPRFNVEEVVYSPKLDKYIKSASNKRVMIKDENERIMFIARFILRNYANRSNTYEIPPHSMEWLNKQVELANTHYHEAIDDVSLTINGTRYRLA